LPICASLEASAPQKRYESGNDWILFDAGGSRDGQLPVDRCRTRRALRPPRPPRRQPPGRAGRLAAGADPAATRLDVYLHGSSLGASTWVFVSLEPRSAGAVPRLTRPAQSSAI
jgi:hypothetical protein